jgi:hypothetical protein
LTIGGQPMTTRLTTVPRKVLAAYLRRLLVDPLAETG